MSAVLCIDEPYASAIFANLKRWETRPSPPNGEMRPEGVRGFPGSRLARGERIIIASTQKRPGSVAGWTTIEGQLFAGQRRHYLEQDKGEIACHLHPGHVVGSVVVTAALPIVADCDDLPDLSELIETFGGLLRWWPECAATTDESRDISDQLPWGDWTPGRWAWKLTDPVRTDEQCPNDCARFDGRVPGHTMGSNWAWVPCWACKGEGSCPPIPYRGHQGLRAFDAGMLR